jgi:hypothetical protein
MAFTETEVQDILQALEEHPKLQQKLARIVAVEDVKNALETGMADIRSEIATGAAQAATEQQKVQKRVAKMETGLASLKADQGSAFAETKTSLSEMTADRQQLKKNLTMLETQVKNNAATATDEHQRLLKANEGLAHRVEGLQALAFERFYLAALPDALNTYLKGGKDMRDVVLSTLQKALENGDISEAEKENAQVATLLWGVCGGNGKKKKKKKKKSKKAQKMTVVAVEASWTVDTDLVERAVKRSDVLRRAGIDALPVIMGNEWPDEADVMARERHAVLVLDGQVDADSWDAALSALRQADEESQEEEVAQEQEQEQAAEA